MSVFTVQNKLISSFVLCVLTMLRTYMHPLQAAHVLSTYINLQAWHAFVFVWPVPAGPMYTIIVPLASYGAQGQRPPPLVHYNSHYHALLFPITVNQLSLRGKGEVWTSEGYWETPV